MPKTQDFPIASITNFQLVSKGNNIEVENNNVSPTNKNTTDETKLTDQSVIDLGQAYNTNMSNSERIDDNKIKLTFTAYINDHANVTEGASFWIGAGVIGQPKMVWVGQFKMITTLSSPSIPFPKVDMGYSGDE